MSIACKMNVMLPTEPSALRRFRKAANQTPNNLRHERENDARSFIVYILPVMQANKINAE